MTPAHLAAMQAAAADVDEFTGRAVELLAEGDAPAPLISSYIELARASIDAFQEAAQKQ